MKSIKPGRGPSGMSFIGSLAAVVFGIIWTVIASGLVSNAPLGIARIFPLFGIGFIVFGVLQAAYHYRNATGKERFSIFDVADSHEEGDPANKWIKKSKQYGVKNNSMGNNGPRESEEVPEHDMSSGNDVFTGYQKSGHEDAMSGYKYCPYCGTSLGEGFLYCPGCGKSLA